MNRRIYHAAFALTVAAVATWAAGASAAVSVVNANAAAPGDNFTNATGTNTGSAVGVSGWYYNNVRNNGVVGINTNLPQSGNGSAFLQGTQGPGGASSKADIELLPAATANGNGNWSSGAALGTLGSLTSFGYDWYRDSSSTADPWLHPVLRLQVFDPTNNAFGYLVFEREVNRDSFGFPPGPTNVPQNQWVTDNIVQGDYRLWSTGSSLPFNLNGTNGPVRYYDAARLSEWQSSYGNMLVVGVSAGIGSGWGPFSGAVDNITIGFSGAETTYNFEVTAPVPEPGSIVAWSLLGLAVAGTYRWRRRR